jgi:hypothetical protein
MHRVGYLVWLFTGWGLASGQMLDGIDCTDVSGAEELFERATGAVPGAEVQLCVGSGSPRC